jgi:hypothetical protein
LRDDDDDLAFLEKECSIDDIVAGYADGGDEDDNSENEEIPDESIDVSEVHKKIKERAQEGVRVLMCSGTFRINPFYGPAS